MNTDDIMALAREADIDREQPYLPVEYREPWNSCTDAELARFARLIRAAALEEAAKEAMIRVTNIGTQSNAAYVATAIRQLKDKK